MKRLNTILVAALAVAALLPTALPAQQIFTATARRGLLGIQHVPAGAEGRQHVVMEVIRDSPAEKAGLMAGDTIIRINGLTATAQVMNVPFEPGDTVVLRVKRGGGERDVRMVAAERPGTMRVAGSYTIPDTVMGRITVMLDAMRADMDTIHMGSFRMRKGDSTWTFSTGGDSMWFSGTGDSIRVFRFGGADSLHRFFHRDSVRAFGGEFRGLIELDSMRTHIMRAIDGMPGIIADSLFMSGMAGERVFRIGTPGDSVIFTRPGEIFTSGMSIGMRAVAGAELSELNPGLSEYFGATSGVLVLNAREGTPAARAGLRAGDVITRANNIDIASVGDLRRAIDRSAPGTPVRLQVQRRGERVDMILSRD